MKNLFYKELKLSLHPLCYVLVALLSTEALSPGIPGGINFLYTTVIYTMLFIGVNKAASTNDLFYTLNLPIRKKDVVKARLISVAFLQIAMFILTFGFLLITELVFIPGIKATNPAQLEGAIDGIGATQGIAFLGVGLLTYAFADTAYFLIYYKTGKSIVLATLISPFVALACAFAFDVLPVVIFGLDAFTVGSANANYFLQFAFLIVGAALYAGSRFFITNKCGKYLENLDF